MDAKIFAVQLAQTEREVLAKLAAQSGRSLGAELRAALYERAQAAGLTSDPPRLARRGRPRKVAA